MDPDVWESPGEFRLDRDGGKGTALSFGSGIHYCLGSNLVKLEMRLALQCLLRRFASLRVLDGYQRMAHIDVGNWGFVNLKVQLCRRSA